MIGRSKERREKWLEEGEKQVIKEWLVLVNSSER